jgi:hypothetical protein
MYPLQQHTATHEDRGLPLWVLPACLLLAAAACAFVLTFTIRLMDGSPAPATPPPAVASIP